MVHAVGGEPVDLLYLDFQVFDGPLTDVFEAQLIRVFGAFVAHGADQPRTTTAGQGEDGEEVRFVEVDVQFAVEGRA
ncbi:hypothetical protein D3C77_787030 [compost metagenome]